MVFKKKFLSSVIALGLVVSNMFISNANTQQLEVHHINVGQGESIYIELPDGSDILIDAGKSNYGSTVVNYLKGQEKDIDIEYLIATHPDADHVGGMQEVFKKLNIKNFIYPTDAPHDTKTWQNVLSLADAEGCTITDSTPGTTFNIGGATMKFIHSSKDFSENNDDSVVTYLDYNNAEFLFTGDIEATAEYDMLIEGLVPDVDFMTVPHHGSKGSSTEAFLAKAKPEYAIVSVGNNSYGHPTADALNRYSAIGANIYRTDQLGDIVIKTDGKTATINDTKVGISNTSLIDIESHWAKDTIIDFINKGIVNGYPNGTFMPNQSVTRAEFVNIVNGYFGFKERAIVPFDDVNDPNLWYYKDVSIAVKAGYINGKSANIFAPSDPITRQEVAKILTTIMKNTDSNYDKLDTFKDGNTTSDWAKSYVEGALEAGYLKGDTEGNLNPTKNITRAEALVMLSRVIANSNPVTPTVEETTPIPPVTEDTSSIVYANGGSSSSNKYHKSANAHGMKDAIKMTESEAKKKGYVACGSCYR